MIETAGTSVRVATREWLMPMGRRRSGVTVRELMVCPQCNASRPLTAHGLYSRTLVDIEFDDSIRIRRYVCHACKRTVSLLPEFTLP